jgi:hypothetical protein
VLTLVTDIPLEEVKLIKKEREEGMSTFYEVCPRSIWVDLDLQALQQTLQSNEQQRQNIFPILP